MPAPDFPAPKPALDPQGAARLRPAAILARLLFFGGSAAIAAYGAIEMHGVVAAGGVTLPEWAFLALFALAFAWIGQAAVTALLGLAALLVGGPRLSPPAPDDLRLRTALVTPIYNEAPERVFARLLAMAEALHAQGYDQRQFEFWVISDTTDPTVIVAEELAFQLLRAALPPTQQAWYRRRARNAGRKAGNVAEWVQRWGARYDCILVLDADSLMEARAIAAMAGAMQAEPGLACCKARPP